MTISRLSMFPTASASRRTTSIVTSQNVAGFTDTNSATTPTAVPVVSTLSGALTAATLKTMLNVTGSGGVMPFLSVATVDATARTMRIVVTVDGVAVFDRTSASFSAFPRGALLAGVPASSNAYTLEPIRWTTSLKIEIASSLTETDKLITHWWYNLES